MNSTSPKPRILFVEDEATVREHLARQLSDLYDVETAADGEQALRAVLRRRPDVIITDLVMPTLDGIELVKTLRATPSTATIPILMLSGRAPDELRLEGFEVGADAFLAKPYTERALRVRIHALLHTAQLRADIVRREALARAEDEAVRERATLLESISDAFYAVDRQWRITYINQRAVTYFGVPREQLIGQVIWDCFPADRDGRIEEEFRTVMRNQASSSFEVLSPLTRRWVELNVYPTPQGIAVNSRDITGRKAAEHALRDLTATLEQRVESAVAERKQAAEQLAQMQKIETIGQLTGGVAHDFNNLLTPIVGALDMIRRRYANDVRTEQLLNGAMQAADRARSLIQRLLAFARKQHLEARPVDVKAVLSNTSELLRSTLGPHIEIAVELDDELPHALVDPNQLELALLNLAVNARDAMPTGGKVRLSAKKQRVDRHVTLSGGEYVSISVADNGLGMDAQTLRRAIEPFFTTKGAGQGTGLGLSMVHGLVAQSGGDLALSSTLGHGTTATLLLPISREQALTVTAERNEHEKPLKEIHVLLVDDEDLVRQSVAAQLSEAGCNVIEAASAELALALIEQGRQVDAVVTDYAMPGMTGLQLAAAVRRRLPRVPLLLITGFAALTDEALGGLPRLAKPFRQSELIASLAEVIERATHR